MMILFLVASLFPSNSYEAGHYLYPMAVGEVSYEVSNLAMQKLFRVDEVHAKSYAIGIGFVMGGISYLVLVKKHYQTYGECEWGAKGVCSWTIFRVSFYFLGG